MINKQYFNYELISNEDFKKLYKLVDNFCCLVVNYFLMTINLFLVTINFALMSFQNLLKLILCSLSSQLGVLA